MEADVTQEAHRTVGILRLCIASEHRNSRIEERNTLRPSALDTKSQCEGYKKSQQTKK